MARKRNKSLYTQMHKVLADKKKNAHDALARGESRHTIKQKTGSHAQKDYIWASKSYDNHVRRMKQFSRWLDKEHPDIAKSSIGNVTREVAQEYLVQQDKNGKSASTVSADMAMLNKVFDYDLRKNEIGLSSRKIDEFTNNRDGRSFDELQPKEKDAVMISRAFGFRRSELLQLNDKSLYRTDDGKLYAYISGKGGRVRLAECTSSARKWAEERFEGSINRIGATDDLKLTRDDYKRVTEGSERLIDNVRSSAPIHRLGRQFYARELLQQVQEENRTGALYEQNKAAVVDTYTTNGITMDRYHAQVVSENLGHSRIDVLKNYIF